MLVRNDAKIKLLLLPYWSAIIPPVGIASLKSYLMQHGYTNVHIVDANISIEFKQVYERYLNILLNNLPEGKRGNFRNVSNSVWQDHALARLKTTDTNSFVENIIETIFFHNVSATCIGLLEDLMDKFYSILDDYINNELYEEDIQIFGLSIYGDTLAASLYTARIVKKKKPSAIIIIGGGIFAEPLSVETLNFNIFIDETKGIIDYIIVGEGERLVLALLKGELNSENRVFTLEDLNKVPVDLKTLNTPCYEGIDINRYFHLSTFASRSCIFQCSFCSESNLWGIYRKKTSQQVAKEFTHLNTQYSYQVILLGDSLLNPIINDLAKEMESLKPRIYWDGYLRADKHVCDKDNTLLWRRGGFYRARLGLESGSNRVLQLMGKKIDAEQIRSALKSLAYVGIKTTTYWVVGYPGETETDFQLTLDLIEELKDYIYEADCNAFAYFPKAQHNSSNWENEYAVKSLYPEKYNKYLILKTWYLECSPSRQEVFDRINRFVAHCESLGIPNPYTIQEIYIADERWKTLNPNSVPSLLDIIGSNRRGMQYIEDRIDHPGETKNSMVKNTGELI
jgi:radical SAM superfamily enzyme YgiQ (UPF0313 family)